MEHKIFGIKEKKKYIERDGSYLLALNNDFLFPVITNKDGCYLVGGGTENQETPWETLKREVAEEIGSHVSDEYTFACCNTSYYTLYDIDYCSKNYFYYTKVLNKYKSSEDHNVLQWLTIEEALDLLTLEHQRWAVSYFFENLANLEKKDEGLLESYKFIKGLQSNETDVLKKIRKSDLHNHAPFGGSPDIFMSITGHMVDASEKKFKSLVEMNQWCDENVSRLFNYRIGYLNRIKAAFLQAKLDGVTKLCLNFGVCAIKYFSSVEDMIECIEDVKDESMYDGIFLPELCLDRHKFSIEYIETFKKLLNTKYFSSLDLTGDENLSIDWIIPLYRLAEQYGMILKAHIGEFGNASSVLRTIKDLHLHEIQHGINIIESHDALQYVKDNNIILNIAPTSNLSLGRISDLKNHPIKKLVEKGIRVTVNTDDNLIFNTTINDEYLKLYKSGALSAEKLNQIRLFGLKDYI